MEWCLGQRVRGQSEWMRLRDLDCVQEGVGLVVEAYVGEGGDVMQGCLSRRNLNCHLLVLPPCLALLLARPTPRLPV